MKLKAYIEKLTKELPESISISVEVSLDSQMNVIDDLNSRLSFKICKRPAGVAYTLPEE